MINLTEQWKNGELKSGWYFVKVGKYEAEIDLYDDDQNQWFNRCDKDIYPVEVLALVPSYDHFVELTEKDKENLQLKQKVTSRNKRLQKYKKLKGELATLASNRNILIKRLKEENAKIKELLIECREEINPYIELFTHKKTFGELLTKIDEVLNDKLSTS